MQDVADLVHSAAIHLLRRAGEQDRSAGMSPARLSALSVVVFRGPLTLGELAAAEGVRSATMTGIVNGLERDGLARRRPHASDGRAVLIEATAAGRRRLKQARRWRIEAVAAKLEDLSPQELELVWRAGQLLEERFALRPWRPV
ncbi:MAG: MarR family transcriptional regulator [Actinomycetota bacterium]|nr:MarR family transcriptional regulator [Actinomycetota bacterium]